MGSKKAAGVAQEEAGGSEITEGMTQVEVGSEITEGMTQVQGVGSEITVGMTQVKGVGSEMPVGATRFDGTRHFFDHLVSPLPSSTLDIFWAYCSCVTLLFEGFRCILAVLHATF